jgi:predicted nucleic acid-binding Zn ribbon protein
VASNRQKKATPVPIGRILPDVLHGVCKRSDMEMVRVWEIWEPALGAAIAANARPAAFKDRLLVVHVSSSPWMQQLRYLKTDLIAKLNQALAADLVADIRFKIGMF